VKKLVGTVKSWLGVPNEATRDKWLAATLKNKTNGSLILDAGAGEGRNKRFCSHLNYISQDICMYDGRGSEEGLQSGSWDTSDINIISDISAIPLADESVDIVLCTEVLEHLAAPDDAIKEFCRLLKPGGTLILTAPFCSVTHFAPFFYVTGYSEYWYRKKLEENFFKINQITYNGGHYALVFQELIRAAKTALANKTLITFIFLGSMTLVYALLYKIILRRTDTPTLASLGCMVLAEKTNEKVG
jgi:ubiquinone/menaquinone biosynthesis C-methylase UbiE